MRSTTQDLLQALLQSAQDQLDAARRLDAAALDEATERRHAAAVAISAGPRIDPEAARPQVEAIRRIDSRLTRILRASERTFRRVMLTRDATYDRHGRLSEGRA